MKQNDKVRISPGHVPNRCIARKAYTSVQHCACLQQFLIGRVPGERNKLLVIKHLQETPVQLFRAIDGLFEALGERVGFSALADTDVLFSRRHRQFEFHECIFRAL